MCLFLLFFIGHMLFAISHFFFGDKAFNMLVS